MFGITDFPHSQTWTVVRTFMGLPTYIWMLGVDIEKFDENVEAWKMKEKGKHDQK